MKYDRGIRPLIAGLLALAYTANISAETVPAEWQLPPLKIVDETSAPVANVEVAVVQKGYPVNGFNVKRTDKDGQVIFSNHDSYTNFRTRPDGKMQVMALARGLAPAFAEWDLKSTAPKTIVTQPGKAVDLILETEDGRDIPGDLKPRVFDSEYAMSYYRKPDSDSGWLVPAGKGRYRFHLQETSRPLYLAIEHPGFLVGYRETFETTTAIKLGEVRMKLPKPATVRVHMAKDNSVTSGPPPLQFSLGRWFDLNENLATPATLYQEDIETGWTSKTIEIQNVAPAYGLYDRIQARLRHTLEEASAPGAERKNLYAESHSIRVLPGETTSVQFLYRDFTPRLFKGNGTATFRFKQVDGSPAAGIKIHLMADHPDFSNWYSLLKGPVDDTGTTVIEGLATDVTYMLHKGWGDTQNISGFIQFKDGATSITQDYTLRLGEGDAAPEVALYDLETSEPLKLSSLRGQVVLLDFWASWCGPCQKPMAENQEIMEKNAAKWAGKATILAASMDADQQTAIKHVQAKGWKNLKHTWCGDPDQEVTASKAFGVRSIPAAYLINKKGVITWVGHPVNLKVEEEIQRLLAEE